MPVSSSRNNIHTALESRHSARAFQTYLQSAGDKTAYNALDSYLGDFPDGQQIRKAALALNLPEADLRNMAVSDQEATRRVSRLVLLESMTAVIEDPLLQKGLSDQSAVIRSDTARFTGTGTDRTRLYNQLIKLIREDPDTRVRKSAGKRLAESFADLYAIDFDGLPPLSRMLILDALEGHTRIDEERAESLLLSKDKEAAFRAARNLLRWGTLKHVFQKGGSPGNAILKKAAALGVAGYLDETDINDANRERAVDLAGQAGRDDLVRRFSNSDNSPGTRENLIPPALREVEKTVLSLMDIEYEERNRRINELPIEDPGFRKAVEIAYPPPETDISAEILFDMARLGHWSEWSERLSAALSSGDPDIRRSAVLALAVIDPEAAVSDLPSILMDNIGRVRRAAACALASIPSGLGCPQLAEYLKDETEEEQREAVLSGIRDAGAAALARCILDNSENISTAIAGELLSEGIDDIGVELLADACTDETILSDIIRHAGYFFGESILAALPKVDGNARKQLLSSLTASNWADSIPIMIGIDNRDSGSRLSVILKNLSKEELTSLFETVLKKTDVRSRRRIRKLTKS